MMITLATGMNACKTKPRAEEKFNWVVDRFDDIKVLRYQVPGFDTLSLEEKKLIYYLNQAALCGRDIFFRPKRPLQPAHPPHARSDRAGIHGRPHERGFREIRKIPEESVVRQRHTPPLFARQVPARIFRKLLRRTGRRHTRRIFSAGLHTVRCGRRDRDQAGDVRPGALPPNGRTRLPERI